ncbi:NAD-dependent epimerase/dehydratase family protein [Subtercola sp. YIM 133946]|uniref:NAD-dependent epimerase/dehydratase family protein n=1 Tax=Subtercola sp. YIM 133946 TaxID=3118909 RepID=UPI002F941FEB
MAPEERHVLITGAGMLGAHSAKVFLDQGWRVTLVDRALQHGYLHDILGDPDRLTTVQVDLSDEVATEEALDGLRVNVVVNTAALVAARAQEDPILTVDVNVKMPVWLGQWALRAGAERLVGISSWGIYAPDQGSRLTENSAIMSPHVSHYGASKAAMEQVLGALAVDSGLHIVVIRPTIIYGYGPNLGGGIASAIVEDLVLSAVRGENVLIPSNMTSQSEYVYVGDVARAVFGAATYDGHEVFEVFNIGSQETTSTGQFAAALRARFPAANISEAPRDDSMFGPPRQEWATDLTKTLQQLHIPAPLTMTEGLAQFESDLRRATHVDQVAAMTWK